MIEEMLSLNFTNKKVIDIGSGTDLRFILAWNHEFIDIQLLDNDNWIVYNSIENKEINNCPRINVEKAAVHDVSEKSFNVILADINRNVIQKDLSTSKKILCQERQMRLNGFGKGQSEYMITLAEKNNLEKINERSSLEWSMLYVTKRRMA